jgi:glycosyltransferase involved in cell wall biosynthesis
MAENLRKKISIVTPCFNEELNVEDCYLAIKTLFQNELANYDYEHIFCDNASVDNTLLILKRIAAEDKQVRVIVNARNFGPFRSNFNGLLNTTGDAVLVMFAADQQDPPEVIVDFVRKWEEGYKVVYGIRKNREEGLIMRGIRKVYYRMVSRFANINIPPDVGDFQFVDKAIIDVLRQCDDYYPYTRGLIANCGFPAAGVPYTWKARKKGISKNRLYHLIDQGLNGLISFTNLPMRICMFIGFMLALISFGYAVFTLAANLIQYRRLAPPGIPTLITAVFFFSGIQLLFLGILGDYIGAIHFQVRKRPLVIEQERINFPHYSSAIIQDPTPFDSIQEQRKKVMD